MLLFVYLFFLDIYGLLLFLGIDPYWVQQWWKVLLWEPFCHGIKEPLYSALAQILWRTAKKDVINQVLSLCRYFFFLKFFCCLLNLKTNKQANYLVSNKSLTLLFEFSLMLYNYVLVELHHPEFV